MNKGFDSDSSPHTPPLVSSSVVSFFSPRMSHGMEEGSIVACLWVLFSFFLSWIILSLGVIRKIDNPCLLVVRLG